MYVKRVRKAGCRNGPRGRLHRARSVSTRQRQGILEDGKSTQTGGTATPATTGILSTEKRTISGAQCVNAAGAGPPRQSSFRAAESKWDTQKMSTKEVTINVSKTIRPSDRRITKNCVN
ncbi:brain and acute leukemia cytoplasmic protein isoform X3 [Gallus gallus]|uniref:brain and acute leukemia cytoplasmic protein isoform X3 n=1 Tax=Gallus gallus TaxID=9031 RepID=UPI0003506714|nr:brain and acute leukemia cytoplasmic protein isoform X3 [Gallus gallus]